MNCSCRSDIEVKLTKRYTNQFPDAKNHKAILGGYGYSFTGNKMVEHGSVQFTLTAYHLVKKSGEYKVKKSISNMIWSFCPFCGKPAGLQEGGAA